MSMMDVFNNGKYAAFTLDEKISFWSIYIYRLDREKEYEDFCSFSKELYHFMKKNDPDIDVILENILRRISILVKHNHGDNDNEFVQEALRLITG